MASLGLRKEGTAKMDPHMVRFPYHEDANKVPLIPQTAHMSVR